MIVPYHCRMLYNAQLMNALILAGGFGTRLKEVIHDRPKVMAPINGRPFSEYVLVMLHRHGITDVVISTGYLGEYVTSYFAGGEKLGLRIRYSDEPRPLGTGGALKAAQRFLRGSTFLILNGDTYLDTDIARLVAFHRSRKSQLTVALARRLRAQSGAAVQLGKNSEIQSIAAAPAGRGQCWVNAGLYVVEPEIFSFVGRGRVSLESDVFPLLAKRGLLFGYRIREDFIDIGTPQEYEQAKAFLTHEYTGAH